MQPITVTAHGAQYELIHFNAPLPAPGPACCEPLPDEKRADELENEHLVQQRREAQLNDQKEHAGNIIEKLSIKCNEIWNGIDKVITTAADAAENALHEQCEDNAYGRLKKNFPQFVTEKLLGDFRCKLCTRNGVLPGHLQVTTNHVLFAPDDGAPFSIIVHHILCIQAFNFAEAPTTTPTFHSVTVAFPNHAEGVQLFLTSGQLLIFKEFLDLALPLRGGTTPVVAQAFNVIDHAWRAVTPVPNPNFQFIEAEKFIQPDITVYPIKQHPEETTTTSTAATSPATTATATAIPSRIPTPQEQRSLNALETHS